MENQNPDQFIQDKNYAAYFGAYRRILHRLLNHDPIMFELAPRSKIVDIGCGYGDLLKILRERGFTNLSGVEPDLLCRRGALANGFEVSDGTITRTGLADASIDVAIVNMVFHHIDNYAAAINEIARILKPQGLLCFMEPAPTIWRRLMDWLTFYTPLPRFFKLFQKRYMVMKLEMDTRMYPKFLAEQQAFYDALRHRFEKKWLRQGWFFQFGKYRRRM